jgi:TctA family transporter
MKRISTDTDGLRQTTVLQYASRFAFGGAVTVLAALIGRHWGPILGGLFLAFPGIFPSGASLVEQHAEEHKQRLGLHGEERGRQEASLEAAGASCGALGLAAFAAVVWFGIPHHSLLAVLPVALLAWAIVAGAAWLLREAL